MKLKVFVLSLLTSLAVFAASETDMSAEAIAERIKPVAKVHVAGAEEVSAAAAGPRSGADIYNTACFACHGTGALGAPKLGSADDWNPRLANGFDTVWQNALNGVGAMPPRGTCGDCSDDDIKAAIEHMIEGI